MSDPVAAAPSDAASAAAAAGGEPVQADVHDFVVGAQLLVRGQPAVCTRFDYPHVYWQWARDVYSAAAQNDGWEPPELHRSFSATPHLFQVPKQFKRTAQDHNMQQQQQHDHDDHEDGHEDHQHHEHDGGDGGHDERADTSDEEDDEHHHEQQHQGQAPAEQPQQPPPASDANAESDSKDSGNGGGGVAARASLMSMFSRRPEKAVIQGLHSAEAVEVLSSVRAPQSASLEHCSRMRFSLPHKISQLTLLDCEDVDVDLFGVISSVELIRCRRTTVRVQHTAQTFSLDDSDSCAILFPGRQERVLFVSTANCARNVLTAQPATSAAQAQALADDAANPANAESDQKQETPDIEADVTYTIEPPQTAVRAEDTPAPLPSEPVAAAPADGAEAAAPPAAAAAAASSSIAKQHQTVWQNGTFTTTELSRAGPLGYFANN